MKFSPLYSLIPLSVSAVVTRTLTIEGMTPDCPDSCPGNQVDQPSEVGALIACFEALLTGEYPQCTFRGTVKVTGTDKLLDCYRDINDPIFPDWIPTDLIEAVGRIGIFDIADMISAPFGDFLRESTLTVTPASAPTGNCNIYQVREKLESPSFVICGVESTNGINIDGDPIPLVAGGIKLDLIYAETNHAGLGFATDAPKSVCGDLLDADVSYDDIVYEFVATNVIPEPSTTTSSTEAPGSGVASLLAVSTMGALTYCMI